MRCEQWASESRQRALVLVSVLWVLLLLSLLVTNLSLSARSFARQAQNAEQAVRASEAADSGIVWALWNLQQSGVRQWLADGSGHRLALADTHVWVALQDESGKVDLNYAPTELLDGLLALVIEDDTRREALVAAIEDWRDADDLVRLNGAEESEYLAAGRSTGPANREFYDVEELSQVLGMTPDIYDRVRWSLTVNNGTRGINPQFAPADVLMALPGASLVTVEQFIEDRRQAWEDEQPMPAMPFDASLYIETGRAGIEYSVQSWASIKPWTEVRQQALITVRGGFPAVRQQRVLFDTAGLPQADSAGGTDDEQ
ncbi:General secretion pathway protein K [Marinobacterium lacunae]|uniref:General secretion pathway protein K n=1 Tax=Marinobacterium lacunae TaxID=1232683 RepID=A0A081FUA2_9GAMM|nr:type II secretion system protein GspK [Marinobacterium lacunae]KEA62107.1 General secretion pathway protein K [Marinobacterium lacunae]